MHRYQGVLVGQPPCLELWSIVHMLVTISKTLSLVYMLLSFDDYLACSCFMLHVVNTSLNVVFIKTCIYTCTNSEQHLIHICLHFMLICTHYMHMYKLVLMISSFTLVLPIFVFLLHVYVIFIQI